MQLLNLALLALVSISLGALCGGLLSSSYLDWYHRPNDIGAGFLVFFHLFLGGFVGLVVGGLVALLVGLDSWKALPCSVGVILVGSILLGSTLYIFSDHYPAPKIGGCPLMVEVEVQLPAASPEPCPEDQFQLVSRKGGVDYDTRMGTLHLERLRCEAGGWIVSASADLFTSRSERYATISHGEQRMDLPLYFRGYPGRGDLEWSPWRPSPSSETKSPGDQWCYRYRVLRIKPSPKLSEAEYKAWFEAKEREALESLPLDAPLTSWFPHLEDHIPEARRLRALERIQQKPTFESDLCQAMVTDGPYEEAPRCAASAMRVAASFEKPSATLLAGVDQAALDIVARLHAFNRSLPEQDPDYEKAADIDIRFIAWVQAANKLSKKTGRSFIVPLQEIHDLAQIRTDSVAFQNDVLPVARYYLERWTKPGT